MHLANNMQIYLSAAALLFAFGLYTILTRRNIIAILMGVELLLNAAVLNFLTFAFFAKDYVSFDGHVFAVFIMVLAAAEAVVALALLLILFRQQKSSEATILQRLRG